LYIFHFVHSYEFIKIIQVLKTLARRQLDLYAVVGCKILFLLSLHYAKERLAFFYPSCCSLKFLSQIRARLLGLGRIWKGGRAGGSSASMMAEGLARRRLVRRFGSIHFSFTV
jgi:hypothetical protein